MGDATCDNYHCLLFKGYLTKQIRPISKPSMEIKPVAGRAKEANIKPICEEVEAEEDPKAEDFSV